MVSPLIYTFMWILGGFIVPGYDHIQKDVSSLFAVDAYRRWLFQSLSIVCAALLVAFYAGLHWSTGGSGSVTGPLLYFVAAIFGLLVALFFPLDSGGEPVTWRGFAIFQLVSAPVLLAGVLVMFPFTGGPYMGWLSGLWSVDIKFYFLSGLFIFVHS